MSFKHKNRGLLVKRLSLYKTILTKLENTKFIGFLASESPFFRWKNYNPVRVRAHVREATTEGQRDPSDLRDPEGKRDYRKSLQINVNQQ